MMTRGTPLICLALLAVGWATSSTAAQTDGLSNTFFVGERHYRVERLEPDPWMLRSGGPGSLEIWTTNNFLTDGPGPLRLAEVRLVSEGPGRRREVLLSGVTLRRAPSGAGSRGGEASSTAPGQGLGVWEINFSRILVAPPSRIVQMSNSRRCDDRIDLGTPTELATVWFQDRVRRPPHGVVGCLHVVGVNPWRLRVGGLPADHSLRVSPLGAVTGRVTIDGGLVTWTAPPDPGDADRWRVEIIDDSGASPVVKHILEMKLENA
jgi:hypothetical protein